MKPAAVAMVVVALILGLAVGFFVGRTSLERQWSQPMSTVDAKAEKRASAAGADPTPPAGARVLGKMPINRARAALHDVVAKDPAVATLASVGADDEGLELHVVVENRGACTLTEVSGVAYGFDPTGRTAAMNRGGEHYVAFAGKTEIAPGEKKLVSQKLAHAQAATLSLAQIDATTCADGSRWKRP